MDTTGESVGVTRRLFSLEHISLLLTIVSLVLWSYSTIQAKLNIGFYGTIHSFPITFFISLALITIASGILWTSSRNHDKLLFFQWCLLVAAIYLNPLLVGGPAAHTYLAPNHLFGQTEYILRTGHLFPRGLFYHNWPAAWIIIAAMMEIARITDPSLMTALTPIALQFLFLIFLLPFLKNLLGEGQANFAWLGVWIFMLGNWTIQNYLSAQAYGYILFSMILFLLTEIWLNTQSIGYRLALILTIASLAATHVFTSLVVLSVRAGSFVSKRLRDPIMLLFAFVIVMAWTLYGATFYFENNLARFMQAVLRLDFLTNQYVTGYAVGSPMYHAGVQTRIILSAAIALIALAGLILGRKSRPEFHKTAFAMTVAIVVLGLLMGMGYGVDLIQRVYFFALPFAAYFAAKLPKRKITASIMCIMIIVLLPLHFVAHYINTITDYVSPAEIAGTYFFHYHTSRGTILGSSGMGLIRYSEKYGRGGDYRYPEGDISTYLDTITGDYPYYVALTRSDEANYAFNHDAPGFIGKLKNTMNGIPNANLIYVNPDVNLYKYEPEK